MKVLLLNGSPHKNGCIARALCEVEGIFQKNGIETVNFWIGAKPVGGCAACGGCRKGEGCVFGKEDGVNACQKLLAECDGVVIGSPVHYASSAGSLGGFLDRLFYSNRTPFDGKLGAAVVSCRRGGASAAFDRINKYFTISGMPVVASRYWNSVHGNTAEEVEQDAEGLQTMRILGENFSWLLRCIEAGKSQGIVMPPAETGNRTNFIR